MRSNQDPELLRAFAAELKVRRTALEISQDALAIDANVNRSFLAKLEVAKTSPSLTSLFRLAAGLRMEPHELVHAVAKRYKRELRAKKRLDGSH